MTFRTRTKPKHQVFMHLINIADNYFATPQFLLVNLEFIIFLSDTVKEMAKTTCNLLYSK